MKGKAVPSTTAITADSIFCIAEPSAMKAWRMATYNELEMSVQSGSSWTGLESGGLPRLQKAVHNEPDDDCDTESRYGRSRNQRNQWGWNGWRTQFYCGHRTPDVREDDLCVLTAGRVGNRIET